MINLFFRNRRKGENALDLSEIKIIGVGNGGTNVINHLQTHGVKEDSLWACDMDGSVVERAVTTHCLLLGQDGLGSGNSSEESRKMGIKTIGVRRRPVPFCLKDRGAGLLSFLARGESWASPILFKAPASAPSCPHDSQPSRAPSHHRECRTCACG